MILGLVFGFAYVFITPPFQAPDEYNHFFRAYSLSKGRIFTEKVIRSECSPAGEYPVEHDFYIPKYDVGNYVPKYFLKLTDGVSEDLPNDPHNKQSVNKIFNYLGQEKTANGEILVNTPNSAFYSTIVYLPQSVGMLIPRLLNASPLTLMYTGRIFNLLVYLLIVCYAIKVTPYLKNTLMLLGLMPMSLFLAASNSPDSLLISVSFLIFALVWTFQDRKSLSVLLLIAAFILSAIKSAYFLLPLVSSAVLLGKGVRTKNNLLTFLGVMTLSVTGVFIWGFFINKLHVPIRVGVSWSDQLEYLSENFLLYLTTVKTTLIGQVGELLVQFVGNLGWSDTPLPNFFIGLYVTAILLSVFADTTDRPLSLKSRYISVILGLVTACLVITMFYVSWSPVGSEVIEGINGRYFIPISPFILVAFRSVKLSKYERGTTYLTSLLIIFASLFSVYTLIQRFYLL